MIEAFRDKVAKRESGNQTKYIANKEFIKQQ
jgi:hypothetical protein